MGLPPGFVLDKKSTLPPGFVLDSPTLPPGFVMDEEGGEVDNGFMLNEDELVKSLRTGSGYNDDITDKIASPPPSKGATL